MKIKRFSKKQLVLLNWWHSENPLSRNTGVICDGAIRSGKTLCLSLSFMLWAFSAFDGESFALCGKTISSLRRNLVTPLLPLLRQNGFVYREQFSRNMVEVTKGGRKNRFYLFGGRDESSAALIQGCTLAGALFDEAALMPRSFVEQAIARCSVEGSRLWFCCNPEHPGHWFYREWIKKAEEKGLLYLRFTMEDNPALSPEMRKRYASYYSGRFYDRFVRGLWVAAEGLIYPAFSPEKHCYQEAPGSFSDWIVSVDYGTVNPTSMGLWGEYDGVWYRTAEYYWDSRREGQLRTDEEHYAALCELAGERQLRTVIADPSAASFLECIRRHGKYPVLPAKNDVLPGIQRVSAALAEGKIRIHESCADALREFSLYCWDEERPRKENDHAMDDIRYFVSSLPRMEGAEVFAMSVFR